MDRISHRDIRPNTSHLRQKANPDQAMHPKECSMCGDIGIKEELFQCKTCLSRYQHTYCSRSNFPNLGSEIRICNWCLPRNHSDETKWKEESSVLEFKQGDDIYPQRKRKYVLEMTLLDSKVVAESSNRAGEIPRSSNSNDAQRKNIEDMRNGCHIAKRQCVGDYPQKKETRLDKCLPQIVHPKMVPDLRRGKRRRYKLLSDVIC